MENQHREITGYRELSKEEIKLMNEIKAASERIARLICDVNLRNPENDGRSLSLARTNLQQGFMWLTRSVAKPTTF